MRSRKRQAYDVAISYLQVAKYPVSWGLAMYIDEKVMTRAGEFSDTISIEVIKAVLEELENEEPE